MKHHACLVAGVFTSMILAQGVFAQVSTYDLEYDMPSDKWDFSIVVGDDDSFTTEATANSFDISPNEFNRFAIYETKDLNGRTPPLQSINILGVEWTIGTTATDPEDVPEFRLRMSAKDGSFAQTYILQDSFADDGFVVALDALSFNDGNPDRLDEKIQVKNVKIRRYTPGDFSPPVKNDYQQSFTSGTVHGWEASEGEPGGMEVEHHSDHGLGIRTTGPGDLDPIDEPTSYSLSFGWWKLEDAFTVEPNRVYRVKLTVKSDEATTISVPTRLRIVDDYHDYVAAVRFGANEDGELEGNPTPEGRSFQAWVAVPPQLGTTEVDLYWEVWQDLQPFTEGGSMVLEDIQIKSWALPVE